MATSSMDTLLNIKAFLTTARAGSFSAAARQLGVAPSVITKRISRLEDQMDAKLFLRSTRQLLLTDVGERYLPRYQAIVGEVEEALSGAAELASGVEGHLRIKAPTTVTINYLGTILSDFQDVHPGVSLEVVLVDRSVNPIEEGYDVAIGALPASYANVIDEPLCPYPRVLCAAPDYLDRRGAPQHPRDLVDHDCLTFHATGSTWSFESPRGRINVEVRTRFSANDTQILHDIACRSRGIAVVAEYIARQSLASKRLVPVLPAFPVAELWLKALVPLNKSRKPAMQALISYLKQELQPVPPWDR
jgi:DNA-binding transcriptional LysR family regulator